MSSQSRPPSNPSQLARLAWSALFFNLGVIVWGAYVRASGSGAGCGSHWPLCNGVVIPDTTLSKTAIEFAHRVTSGGSLIFSVAIAWLGVRSYPKGSRVRKASWGVLGFTLSEALIGAGLVLFSYVEHDRSIGRVVSICLHLSNTFMLLAALSLTAWWSTYPATLRPRTQAPAKLRRLSWLALALTTFLGVTGAITALGDTLFQSTSLASGLAQDFHPASHFILRLRAIHPFLAVVTAGLLFFFAELAIETAEVHGSSAQSLVRKLSNLLKGLVAFQLGLGALNLLWLAPTSLQLAHLFVAESLWVALVLTVTASWAACESTVTETTSRPASAELAAQEGSAC
jgi:heme A synthase